MAEDKKRRILRERALRLAQRDREQQEGKGASMECLTFCLGRERYAVGSLHVGEVFPLRGSTPLPCVPPFVAGIVNLRGQILSLVDLKVLFGLSTEAPGPLVVVLRSKTMEMGLLVDPPLEVRSLPLDAIHPPIPTLAGPGGAYLLGMAEEDLALLDGGRLLGDPALVVSDSVS